MPFLPESARNRILRGGFLTQEELSQEQYALITSPSVTVKEIFSLHDTLFGGNLSNINLNNVSSLPFIPDDISPDLHPQDDYPDSAFIDSPEPVRTPSLCEI